MRVAPLILFVRIVCIAIGVSSGGVWVVAQSPNQNKHPTVVTIDVVLKPTAPSPIPIPYPNISIRYASKTNVPKLISQGESLTFFISGEKLEEIGSIELYTGSAKSSQYEVKLDRIPRGKKGIRQRRVTLTPRTNLKSSTIYKFNFRRDLKAKAIYTQEFSTS